MPFLKKSNVWVSLVACVVLLNGCAPVEEESGTEADAPDVETITISAPEPPATPAPAPEPEPVAASTNWLIGTTWAIADYTVTFQENGVVRFNSGSEGTWALAGETITISVAGEDTVITVDGDRLTHDGMTLERQ